MPDRPVRVVDVFTDKPLSGNQLAVILDGRNLSDRTMQRIAQETNLPETTFVLPAEDPKNAARVRIFTPQLELPFAGHPTIGTAWVLADEGLVQGLEFTLEEGVGRVPVRGVRESGRVMFWMTHPPFSFGQVYPHRQVAETIGVNEDAILPDVPAQIATTGNPFLFVALRDNRAVDSATPDPARVRQLVHEGAHGVFLFTQAGPGRLYSRMFAVDVLEDPVTGSASGPLGAFAVRYGLIQPAQTVSIISEQGTKMGRQGFAHIELEYGDDRDIPVRIEVGGGVMPVFKGTLTEFDM
jgi:trans-2,3-dihydro-3-hydroxyanthranilate isomerase